MKLREIDRLTSARPCRPGRERGPGQMSPLRLWRERYPSSIAPDEAAALEGCLASIAILNDRAWSAARAGDPAAAAAAAIGRIRVGNLEGSLADIIMGNLVLLARRGDVTAPMLLAHALGILARRHPERPLLLSLAAAWAGQRGAGGQGLCGRRP